VRFIAACVNGLDLTVAGFAHVDPKRIGRPELRGGGRLRQRARSYPARGRGTRHSMVAAERIRSVTTASYLASWPWERKPSGRASSLGSRFGSGCRTQDASSSGRCETVAAPRARCRYLACFDGFHRVPASVSKTCLVRFDTGRYSVAASAVGRPGGKNRRCFGRDQPVGRRVCRLWRPARHGGIQVCLRCRCQLVRRGPAIEAAFTAKRAIWLPDTAAMPLSRDSTLPFVFSIRS
jgi:hypothetical protein